MKGHKDGERTKGARERAQIGMEGVASSLWWGGIKKDLERTGHGTQKHNPMGVQPGEPMGLFGSLTGA